MRIACGVALLAGTFWLSYLLADMGFVGLYNAPALVLIGLAPLAISVIAYELDELRHYASVAKRALGFREGPARSRLISGLIALGKARRSGKLAHSVEILESTDEPLVELSGLVLVKQYEPDAIREVFGARLHSLISKVKRAEDFFSGLARLAPSFGLIGTIIGFIDLLEHLSDPDSLGPGMAMALSATLYGIAVSYCVFHPIAKSVGTYGRKLTEHGRLAQHAVQLLHEGKGATDLRMLFDEPTAVGAVAPQTQEAT